MFQMEVIDYPFWTCSTYLHLRGHGRGTKTLHRHETKNK